MYEKFFPANDANSFANNVFRNFDADRNGSIDFTEFMIAIDVTSSGEPREKLMWAFRSVFIILSIYFSQYFWACYSW